MTGGWRVWIGWMIMKGVYWIVSRPSVVGWFAVLMIAGLLWVPYLSSRLPVVTELRQDASFWEGQNEFGWVISLCRNRPDAVPARVDYVWHFQNGSAVEPLLGVKRVGQGIENLIDNTNLTAAQTQCDPPVLFRFRTRTPLNGEAGDRIHTIITYRVLWGWSWWTQSYSLGTIRVPEFPIREYESEFLEHRLRAAQPQLQELSE